MRILGHTPPTPRGPYRINEMTTFDGSRTPSTGYGPVGMISRFVGTVAAWNDARMTRKALASLSARELDDIGLVPGDIDTVVEQGRRR